MWWAVERVRELLPFESGTFIAKLWSLEGKGR